MAKNPMTTTDSLAPYRQASTPPEVTRIRELLAEVRALADRAKWSSHDAELIAQDFGTGLDLDAAILNAAVEKEMELVMERGF